MGWWSTGVQDGDGPWDIIDAIDCESGIGALAINDDCEEINIGELSMIDREALYNEQRKAFKAFPLDAMIEMAKENSHDGDNVAIQVVGFLHLKWETTMSDEFQKSVLQAIDDDEWSKEDAERKQQMAHFRECVVKQDGDGLPIRGLFWSAVLSKRTHFD